MLLAPVAQWIEQWFPVPCAGVRFPSGVLHGSMNSSDALYHKEDKNLDDFREWLSDNLRYFMLGGAILIIVLVLFFGVRACVGSNKGNSGDGQKTVAKDQGNVPSSPTNEGESDEKKEDANSMEKADADITALIKSYYKALGEKDIATLKTLEDDFTPSDESKVTNLKDYIEGYEVGDVYTKKGMTEDSYVVYVCFSYICQNIETKAPALTQFYVYKNSDGSWIIDNDAMQDPDISAYLEKQLSDSDVAELVTKVQNELDQAQQKDEALAAFLNGLGDESDVSVQAQNGTLLTVAEECNVRAEANTDSEILGVISEGEQVEKTGTDGEWVQIDYDGQTGYIRGDLLTDGSESVDSDSDTSEDSGDSDSEEYDSQDSGSGEEEQE